MLDHEEKFLFKEEILHLSNAVAEPGILDNVEDLLTDVITSPRFDSEVFTLERSLQVMLGARAGTTLVGLLTVAPEVFEEVRGTGLMRGLKCKMPQADVAAALRARGLLTVNAGENVIRLMPPLVIEAQQVSEAVDAETMSRLRDALALIERKTAAHG